MIADQIDVTTKERQTWEAHQAKIQKEIDALRLPLNKKADAMSAKLFEERLAQLPEVLRADLKAMLATAPDKRDMVQKYLAEKFEKTLRIDHNTLKSLDPAFKKEAEEAEGKIRGLESQRLPEPRIQALWDRGVPSPTYIYRRGELLKTYSAADFAKYLDHTWRAGTMQIVNAQTGRATQLVWTGYRFRAGLDAERGRCKLLTHLNGEMSEWLKEHAWKMLRRIVIQCARLR